MFFQGDVLMLNLKGTRCFCVRMAKKLWHRVVLCRSPKLMLEVHISGTFLTQGKFWHFIVFKMFIFCFAENTDPLGLKTSVLMAVCPCIICGEWFYVCLQQISPGCLPYIFFRKLSSISLEFCLYLPSPRVYKWKSVFCQGRLPQEWQMILEQNLLTEASGGDWAQGCILFLFFPSRSRNAYVFILAALFPRSRNTYLFILAARSF